MLPEVTPSRELRTVTRLDSLARAFPRTFDVVLGLLAVVVTVLLLLKTGSALVLYQGF